MYFSIIMVLLPLLSQIIPYSGKLSRDKTFANFADLEPFVKVFSANFKCTCAHASHPTVDPTKIFSAKSSIFTFSRKFDYRAIR